MNINPRINKPFIGSAMPKKLVIANSTLSKMDNNKIMLLVKSQRRAYLSLIFFLLTSSNMRIKIHKLMKIEKIRAAGDIGPPI
jgi:hypothetical protein